MRTAFKIGIIGIYACLMTTGSLRAQAREEFDGPFPDWADVRQRFGAKGNGQGDDTRSLQQAIDQLSNPATGYRMGKDAYMVVYLPAGTYCISSTLVLKGKIGVSIIGEDPAHTIIKWMGKDSSMLLWANGSSYFRISRITWDANHHLGMEGIGVHWKDKWDDGLTRSFAPLNIELSDCFFMGGFNRGISGGTYGSGSGGTGANDSEIAIRRCVFRACGEGIEITGYNALDYWIWDCRFLKCGYGVKCSFGNYHVYRSFFSGDTVSDTHNTNGYYTSVRGCYSVGSERFSWEAGISSNPFKRVFQDNTVIGIRFPPVIYTHLGKLTLWGNRFSRQRDNSYKHTVLYGSWAAGNYEVMSLHNVYTCKDPIYMQSAHKIFTMGDEIRPGAELRPDEPAFLKTMDPEPPRMQRRILEVPPGADAELIQSVLNQASALKGERPVVHFGVGVYQIDKTLEIAAGSDMQLIGEGLLYATVIRRGDPRAFPPHSPLLRVKGPSYISIRDMQIGAEGETGEPSGIVFENVDQSHAEAHLDQVYSHADTSLFIDGMNHLYVQKDNSFFTAGNYLMGGPLVQQGKGEAVLSCYGGQFARLTVRGSARFLAKDCWWEGGERVPLALEGSGSISIDGAMIAPDRSDSGTTIRIGKFNGSISLMDMYLLGALTVQPDNPALNLLVWNIHFYHKMDPLGFIGSGATYTGAFLGLNAQCFRANDPACKNIISIPDRLQHIRDLPSFLDARTALTRMSAPRVFSDLPPGVSNIYISRVSLGTMDKGIVFAGSGEQL